MGLFQCASRVGARLGIPSDKHSAGDEKTLSDKISPCCQPDKVKGQRQLGITLSKHIYSS